MAVNTQLNDVKIVLQNGYEMTALTSKTKVSDILEENNIILEDNQKTIPDLDSEIAAGETIKITDKSYNEVQIAQISEEGVETSLDQLLENYAPVTEKIVVEQVTIPYETVTKNTTNATTGTTNKVLQQGKDGLKEVTYKVKYQNDIEIEKDSKRNTTYRGTWKGVRKAEGHTGCQKDEGTAGAAAEVPYTGSGALDGICPTKRQRERHSALCWCGWRQRRYDYKVLAR